MRASSNSSSGGGPPTARAAPANVEDLGQGWTQQTEQGKIYLSRKEKNVFILEGTKAAGFSACMYKGSMEEVSLIEGGCFSLTCELKCAPGDQCADSQVFVLLDSAAVSDLSSGCDFCGIHLSFDSRELRVENHRRNASVQTLFAQPSCALLRLHNYVTLLVDFFGESLSLSLSGVSIIANLPHGRPKATGGPFNVGLAVYGRTRCYIRRFRVGTASAPLSEEGSLKLGVSPQGAGVGSQSLIARGAGPSPGRRVSSLPGSSSPAGHLAAEEMELAAMIERDIVAGDLRVRFEDIGGLEDAKRAINEAVLLPLLLPEFFVGLRKPWKGVLLFGPPGTGKTMLAKAVASCAENVTFFNCSSATLTSKWRGESEKLLRALFNTARARVPSILFFDEIDSLLSQRGTAAEHEASRRFKSEFLIHMDGLLSDARPDAAQAGHLLVLATSNAPWDLDEALRRRLEKRIYIPLPDEGARHRMFQHHMKDILMTGDVDFLDLAARTEGYSGADIELICRDASMNPMRRLVDGLSPTELVQLKREGNLEPGHLAVEMSDFEAAVRSVQPSVGSGDTKKYSDWAKEFGSR